MSKKKVKPKSKKPTAKGTGKSKRRNDWAVNDQLISNKFAELLLRTQKLPSYEDIARELKVDVSTVKRHVGSMDFKERFIRFRCASDKVMMNLFKQAATGKNHHMIRMWLELFEELGAKKTVDVNVETMIPITKIEIVHTDVNTQGKQGT